MSNKKDILKELLDDMAKKSNTIDLNAYALGLKHMQIALKNMETSSRIIRWVPLSEKEMPELCTEVLVRYTHDRSVAVRLFDGDGRFYNEIQDRDITDSICEWAALPQ